MSQIERIYWLDDQIRRRRYPNPRKLQEAFGISERAAYDDRKHLIEELNAPLKFDKQHEGWFYTDPTYSIPYLALSERESAALARSMLTARAYVGEADADVLAFVAQRLGAYVPDLEGLPWFSAAGGQHLAGDVSVSPALLADCHAAYRDRQKLHLLYYSAHRDSLGERVIHPYHLHNFQGEWHLLAWCEMAQAMRQFMLGRVREWRRLPAAGAYAIPGGIKPEEYFKQGLGVRHGEALVTVRARFSAYQARWARERIYHPSQELEDRADGTLVLTLRVAGTAEVKRWLLGYGAEVEVLEPETLRQEILEELTRMKKIYAPDID